MAKNCPSCGHAIPRNSDKCPGCGAQVAKHKSAALFTGMNAETENWKIEKQESERKKQLQEQVRHNKKPILLAVFAVILAGIIVFFIIFNLPINAMRRMISTGRYDEACTIYQNKAGDSSIDLEKLGTAILRHCDKLYDELNSGAKTTDDVDAAMTALRQFDFIHDELNEKGAVLKKLTASKSSMEKGLSYYEAADFENAAKSFECVIEDDSSYGEARRLMRESYELFGKAAAVTTSDMCKNGEIREAVKYVKDTVALLESKEVFCTEIYSALDESYRSLEGCLIDESRALTAEGDFEGAQAILATYRDLTGEESEAIDNETCKVQADYAKNRVFAARDAAAELYENGDIANAFSILDSLLEEETEDQTDARAVYDDLEDRYYEDTEAKFLEELGSDVSNLESAIKVIDQAVETHETEKLVSLRDKYVGYLPLSLVDALFTDKEGTVLRSNDGWIWGTDGSSITFAVSGTYDYFEGSFGIQRTDNEDISGYFEVYSDKDLIFTSDNFTSESSTEGFKLDISKVNFLVIKFHCNYEASTTNGGYCYHAVYDPVIGKNLPVK